MSQEDNKMILRHTFVGMLFALAIAEAAMTFGDLYEVVVYDWNYHISIGDFITKLSENDYALIAPASHLVLGLILIASSWVGWSRSKAGGNEGDIRDIHTPRFMLLLIEVLLVALYFILIRSVELDNSSFAESRIITDAVPDPSAAPEAVLLCIVFLVYFIWDVLADVSLGPIPREHAPMVHRKYISSIVTFTTGVITRGFVSMTCLFIALHVHTVALTTNNPLSAVWGDCALICLVILFRTGKWSERIFTIIFPWEIHRSGLKSAESNKAKALYKFLIPLLLIFIFVSLM